MQYNNYKSIYNRINKLKDIVINTIISLNDYKKKKYINI